MRIEFIKPDPRAGSIAQMDSSRGQQLVDSGCAKQIKDEPSVAESFDVLVEPTASAKSKTVADAPQKADSKKTKS